VFFVPFVVKLVHPICPRHARERPEANINIDEVFKAGNFQPREHWNSPVACRITFVMDLHYNMLIPNARINIFL
jgi:hypothetical protein